MRAAIFLSTMGAEEVKGIQLALAESELAIPNTTWIKLERRHSNSIIIYSALHSQVT